ncbi:MAG: hypothetical protein M9924_15935 [Rhizobiaceae bacterium]|nr:hypothetical protein [Rhizobiaceae bacterium]
MDQKSPGFIGNLAIKNGLHIALQRGETGVKGAGSGYAHDNDSAWSDDVPAGRDRNSEPGGALLGTWIEDAREGRFETDVRTFEQLQDIIARYAQDGFRPSDIFGSGRFFEPWSVAFVKDEAPGNVWQVTADASAFKRRHEDMLRQGYRLASFNRRHRNFNAVWEPVSTPHPQPVAWNMGWAELVTLDKRQRERGLRIASIDRYGPSGAHYAAVWEPGEGEQLIEAPGGLNVGIAPSIAAMVDRYADAGLSVQSIGHNEHAVVAYRSDASPARRRFVCLPLARFRAYDQICRNGGYRLASVSHASWPAS